MFSPEGHVLVAKNRQYKVGSRLGQGASGAVFAAAELETGRPAAIKFLPRGGLESKYLSREIENHRMLEHPHVISFKAVVYVEHGYVCIIMEFANGGNLRNYMARMGRLSEPQARFLFQQLIIAVDYCHKRGITNRDLKLENTLINWESNQIPILKICDFGFSKADHQSLAKSRVGTLHYMAPEVIQNQANTTYNGKLADVWSCGVMLYYMLCGNFPFQAKPKNPNNSPQQLTDQHIQQLLIQQITQGAWSFPADCNLTPSCQDLLNRMLCPTSTRLDLPRVMSHEWFRTGLDPRASNMNDIWLNKQPSPDAQSMEEIRAELDKAIRAAAVAGYAGYDAIIDAEIEHEEHGGNSTY